MRSLDLLDQGKDVLDEILGQDVKSLIVNFWDHHRVAGVEGVEIHDDNAAAIFPHNMPRDGGITIDDLAEYTLHFWPCFPANVLLLTFGNNRSRE